MPASSKASKKQRPPSAVLTEREEVLVEAVLDGKTMKAAAAEAGCSPKTAATIVRSSGSVKMSIADNRKELSTASQLKRADVLAGFMEAIDVARLAADPGSMIRGWTEIGKMLGLYEPEVVEVRMTAGQRAIQSKYEVMSDAELLAIAEGTVIDGECHTVQ